MNPTGPARAAWQSRRPAEGVAGEADVRACLTGLEKEELVSLLVDRMDEDEHLHRRLLLRAAQWRPDALSEDHTLRLFDRSSGLLARAADLPLPEEEPAEPDPTSKTDRA